VLHEERLRVRLVQVRRRKRGEGLLSDTLEKPEKCLVLDLAPERQRDLILVGAGEVRARLSFANASARRRFRGACKMFSAVTPGGNPPGLTTSITSIRRGKWRMKIDPGFR